jgi:hypothetical protein
VVSKGMQSIFIGKTGFTDGIYRIKLYTKITHIDIRNDGVQTAFQHEKEKCDAPVIIEVAVSLADRDLAKCFDAVTVSWEI